MGNTLQNAQPASNLFIPAEGIFTDQCQDNRLHPGKHSGIKLYALIWILSSNDGTTYTLMLAENSASVPPVRRFCF